MINQNHIKGNSSVSTSPKKELKFFDLASKSVRTLSFVLIFGSFVGRIEGTIISF
jgi:hypothetical protein